MNYKFILKSKTFWFNAVSLILAVIELVSKTYIIDPNIHLLITGIGNIILRFLTTQPVTLSVNEES